MYITLTLCFEAVTTMIVGILGFPDSPDLCNLFDALLIYSNDLMNKWQQVIFQT